jgi:hypothetical protein
MREVSFAILGIYLLSFPASAGTLDGRLNTIIYTNQYDSTIGDARVVLLSISSLRMPFSTSMHGANSGADTTNLEITFISEHIGTNSPGSPITGSVLLYVQKAPLSFNGMGISTEPGVVTPRPLPPVPVTDKGACYTSHVVLKDVHYRSGVRGGCLIQSGFDGQLKDFKFDDILLP